MMFPPKLEVPQQKRPLLGQNYPKPRGERCSEHHSLARMAAELSVLCVQAMVDRVE